MNLLVACEESQRVCIAFRQKGHNAFSCDIQPCSGGHPEWHIQGDVIPLLNPFWYLIPDTFQPVVGIPFITMDGKYHFVTKWDMIIAHPPCVYLTVTGNSWFNVDKYGEKAIQRMEERKKAIDFFMCFVNADCEKIVIENPVGVMSTFYRKPDQIVQPYLFGDPFEKRTCLWEKGVPMLKATNVVAPPPRVFFSSGISMPKWYADIWNLPKGQRSIMRSKTFPGIAKAMADQWG